MEDKFYDLIASTIVFCLTLLAGWGMLVIIDRLFKLIG